MSVCFVYGLIDPRTRFVRYIGKSTTGMSRPKAHREPKIRSRNTHCAAWVRSLIALGLDYEICVLETATRETVDDTERWWIAFARACGWDLTNHTDGGDGLTGFKMSPETRAKMSARMKAEMSTPEAKARVSAAHRGKVVSPETRSRIAAANRGKKATDATRELLRAKHLGSRASDETRARMSIAHRGNKSNLGRTFSEEHRAKLRAKLLGRRHREDSKELMRQAALVREAKKRQATG
jgi:hypothetical protein